MSSACQCHVEGAFCFYCEVYSPVVAETGRLMAEALRLKTQAQGAGTAVSTLMSALREIDTHILATSDPIPHIVSTLKRVLPEYSEGNGDPFAYEEVGATSCPYCRGKGSVGGVYDGDEYIPVESCAYCEGSGVNGTNENAA